MTGHKLRFTMEMGFNGKETPIIRDEEGLDDYYFLDDLRDFKDLCELLNNLNNEKTEYESQFIELTKRIKKKLYQEDTINLTEYLRILEEVTGE